MNLKKLEKHHKTKSKAKLFQISSMASLISLILLALSGCSQRQYASPYSPASTSHQSHLSQYHQMQSREFLISTSSNTHGNQRRPLLLQQGGLLTTSLKSLFFISDWSSPQPEDSQWERFKASHIANMRFIICRCDSALMIALSILKTLVSLQSGCIEWSSSWTSVLKTSPRGLIWMKPPPTKQ